MAAETERFVSLRTKLILFAATLVVVPGGLYGTIAVVRSRSDLERVVGRQLDAEARSAADALAGLLRLERERVRSMAHQDVMRELRVGDVDKRIASFLSAAREGCLACVDSSVIGGDEVVVASSDPARIGVRADVPAFDGTDVILAPTAVPGQASPVLRLVAPIADVDGGKRLGWLEARYAWPRVVEVATRARERVGDGDAGVAVLVVDASDRIIGGVSLADSAWQVGGVLARHAPAGLVPERFGLVDERAGMLVGERDLPSDLPPWRVVVAEPLRSAFAPAYRTAAVLATVLAATLLVALGLAVWAARRVTEPLAALTRAAIRIGQGDAPEHPVVASTHDELGTLAHAFARMQVDLRRAERELIDAAKFAFVGELAAGVAHEVRTPLGVMRSATQLIERSLTSHDEQVRELARLLRDEVDRVERVVSGLLQLARPRDLRVEPCELGQIVLRAADFVEAQAREKGIVVRRCPHTPDPMALCDPDLIYQVALNLLVNAIQVLPDHGMVEITVNAPVNGTVGFVVRDDGPGLDPEVRAHMFEPFFTRRHGGAGLGLTFVQRVVHEHRGRIVVQSEPGRGTVFRVELPGVAA